jgi:hypothetical protein
MLKKPFPQKSNKPPSPTLDKFLQSMKIGYVEWHDGIGYDLEALGELRGEELR